MLRKLLFPVLCVAVAAVCIGCSGPDMSKTVHPPTDIGDPDDYDMGVTDLGQRNWLVKQDVDGETRIWVLSGVVPALAESEFLKYDKGMKIFHDNGRRRKYNLDGIALHSILRGSRKGEEAPALTFKKIELEEGTGSLLLHRASIIRDAADKKDPSKGGYVVVE